MLHRAPSGALVFFPDPFPLMTDSVEPIRLSKRMSELGLASRREADEWIERGWIRVDGVPAVLGQKVVPTQQITVDRAADAEQAARVTVLVNKPMGYVSGQAEDGDGIRALSCVAGCPAPRGGCGF